MLNESTTVTVNREWCEDEESQAGKENTLPSLPFFGFSKRALSRMARARVRLPARSSSRDESNQSGMD